MRVLVHRLTLKEIAQWSGGRDSQVSQQSEQHKANSSDDDQDEHMEYLQQVDGPADCPPQTLEELAKCNNFQLVNVTGDGNCMFDALNRQRKLHGHRPETITALRWDVCDYM